MFSVLPSAPCKRDGEFGNFLHAEIAHAVADKNGLAAHNRPRPRRVENDALQFGPAVGGATAARFRRLAARRRRRLAIAAVWRDATSCALPPRTASTTGCGNRRPDAGCGASAGNRRRTARWAWRGSVLVPGGASRPEQCGDDIKKITAHQPDIQASAPRAAGLHRPQRRRARRRVFRCVCLARLSASLIRLMREYLLPVRGWRGPPSGN